MEQLNNYESNCEVTNEVSNELDKG